MMDRSAENIVCDKSVVVLDDIDTLITDRYRLLFAKLDLVCRKEDKKVIAVTSAVKGEGKTTTTSNLAVVSVRDFGKHVLLIDGDFKNPSVSKSFGIPKTPGLANVIAGECSLSSIMRAGPVEGLTILTMGGRSVIGEARTSRKGEDHIWTKDGIRSVLSQVRESYDYILIDAPPILPLFDMSVISDSVDGILIVIKSAEISEALLSQALKSLGSNKIIGSVLNRSKKTWGSRYYDYGY